jgi:type VI secretion system protein ImpC
MNIEGTAQMNIFYEIETAASTQRRELPFVIGVLGDFVGQPSEPLPLLRDRRFTEITAETFDAVLDGLRPHLAFSVQNRLSEDPAAPQIKVDLQFRRMNDFEPECVAQQVKPIRDLLNARSDMKNLMLRLEADARLDAIVHRCLCDATVSTLISAQADKPEGQHGDLYNAVTRILSDCGWSPDNPWSEWVSEDIPQYLQTLLSYAATSPLPQSRDSGVIINSAISEIERRVSAQLNAILQNPVFKTLEATWRGLAYLFARSRNLPQVKLKVLNMSRRELLRDVQRAPEYDQSNFYKHVYREFGMLGGQPFSVLVGVYEFSNSPVDVALLERIAQVVSAAHCPFLAVVEPAMLQLESFLDLEVPRSLVYAFESTTYAMWTNFRFSAASRYVGLVMPRILLRRPHEVAPIGDRATTFFAYIEQIHASTDLLWGNPAFALAANLADGFVATEFAEAPIGSESGGTVSGLPVWSSVSDQGEPLSACVTEIGITDQRQVELSNLGFIALCHRQGTSDALFFTLPSCCLPRNGSGENVSIVQLRLGVQLENILVASRFAHYIKCILRDKFGTFTKLSEWENYLDSWINQFSRDNLTTNTHQYRPLTGSSIRIEPKGLGGVPQVIVTLAPHFRNRAEDVALRIVVSLPQMKEVRA